MTAKAGMLRCCCVPLPNTCTQVTNYCPEYIRVTMPTTGYVRRYYTGAFQGDPSSPNGAICRWQVGTSVGCYYPPSNPNNYTFYFGHPPEFALVRQITYTVAAQDLLFKRVTVVSGGTSCQGQCVACARYCLVADPALQIGKIIYNVDDQFTVPFFGAQFGGAFPLVWASAGATGFQFVKDIPTPANRTGTLAVTQTGSGSQQRCRYNLNLNFLLSAQRVFGGATSHGCHCTCCGFGVGCNNCLQNLYPVELIRFLVDQEYSFPFGLQACPNGGSPLIARARMTPQYGLYYTDMVDPALSTIQRNGCADPAFNDGSHDFCYCNVSLGNPQQCTVTEAIGNGPCTFEATTP